MTKYYLAPYKMASGSAKKLAAALGAKRIRRDGSKYRPRPGRVVINWGRSDEGLPDGPLLNNPLLVAQAQNKLTTLEVLLHKGVRVPPFTEDQAMAQEWIDGGGVLVCRTILNGHSGKGIVLCKEGDVIPPAPLYTKYVKKQSEYRIHYIGDECFVQRKARRKDVPDDQVDWQVRNHQNGFIYANDPATVGDVPSDVLVQAHLSYLASGLDFGAIDIIYNRKEDKGYVLEINTAPGLEGTTLEFYTTNLPKILNQDI